MIAKDKKRMITTLLPSQIQRMEAAAEELGWPSKSELLGYLIDRLPSIRARLDISYAAAHRHEEPDVNDDWEVDMCD